MNQAISEDQEDHAYPAQSRTRTLTKKCEATNATRTRNKT